MSLTMYTIHHQVPEVCINTETFVPFLVGQSRVGGIVADDWGDTIADLHSFAEMRCHYHVWRNRSLDREDHFVGFQHYRRHFIFAKHMVPGGHSSIKAPQEHFIRYMQVPKDLGLLDDVDVVAAMRVPATPSLAADYGRNHNPDDWRAFMRALPLPLFGSTDIDWLYPCNMFIMREPLFCQYMADWHETMFSDEMRVIAPPPAGYQSRVLGFLSERFFTLWLESHPELRQKELPLLVADLESI